jgi:hypothetical protein
MSCDRKTLAAMIGVLALLGCSTGAREVDYSPQRAYSSDIDSSLNHGPTSSKPGMVDSEEPTGAFPWDIGSSRQ